ncbi:MAG: molybdopterin-dependent oxidoreductase [Candidatus Thorarchaeota archaeon]|nr:molybdopterin-dependent oxidoreductase [Candidatus Thorarchaeota archaeon]
MSSIRNKTLSVLGIVMILVTALSVVFLVQQPTNQNNLDDGPIVLTVRISDATINYTMNGLRTFPPITGLAGFIKTGVSPPTISGPYNYTGVKVSDLFADIGTLPENYSLEVLSSDGYTTYFTKSEVQGIIEAYDSVTAETIGPRNFTMIIAYQENEEPLSEEYGGPLRMVFLPDGNYVSAGHSWPKYIANLTIIDETDPWTLEFDGVSSWNMTHDIYYSLGSCPHHRISIYHDDVMYSGVALWTLVASMDGGHDDHYSFNTSLISTNYSIIVWSGTGESILFTSYEVAFNNSLLIAGWADEELLVPPDWPLKLVTSDGFLLGNIVKIVMTGWN